jgi:glycosyltransferase involved in cell wall biosynthesis
MSAGVSIIVCTHNGAARLPAAIEHLNRLQVSRDIPWEVLVVDNGSTDDSGPVAKNAWRGTAPFRVVEEPQLGLSWARLRGLREARYECLSFIDDDNWVSPQWVDAVFDVFEEHPEVGVCGGAAHPQFESDPPSWFGQYQGSYAVGAQAETSGDVTDSRGYVWGAGICVRKAALSGILGRGFSFVLSGRKGSKLSAGEDSELCYTMRFAGWRIWYDERLQLTHAIPPGRLRWKSLCRMFRGFGFSQAVLGLHQQLVHDPTFTRFPRPLGEQLSHVLGVLRRRLPWAPWRRAHVGSREKLEFEFYWGCFLGLVSLVPSYRKLGDRIRDLYIQVHPGDTHPLAPAIFPLGRELKFNAAILPFLRKGWSYPESWTSPDGSICAHYVKTDGRCARMVLPLNRLPKTDAVTLKMQLIDIYVHPQRRAHQRVILYVNRTQVAAWLFSERGYREVSVSFPASILALRQPVELEFRLPDAVTPVAFEGIPDRRLLSVSPGAIQFVEEQAGTEHEGTDRRPTVEEANASSPEQSDA